MAVIQKRKKLLNVPIIMRVVGWLLMMESAFMLLPLAVSLFYGETDWQAFAISTAVSFVVGFILASRMHPYDHHMGKREGLILTGMVWIIFALFGMIPFLICSTPLNLTQAYFESIAGFTTTGVYISEFPGIPSHGIQLWRALMQWLGGMGIILFTLAVIPMLNHSGGVQMFNSEVTGITHDKLRPRISQTAKSLWMLYIVLTLATFGLLWGGPMNWFDALCHAFGTLSTGGFSTSPDGPTAWHSPYVIIVITIFMIFGGANFVMLFKVTSGKLSAIRKNDVAKVYLCIIAIITLLFIAAILVRGQYKTWEDVTILPLFQVVSAITSTGYTVAHFQSWGFFVMALILFMMMSGGCAGSTSGGVKIDRLIVLGKFCHNELYKCVHPLSITSVKVGGKVMSQELVMKVIAFMCLYIIVVAGGAMLLTALGMEVGPGFVAAMACTSNVGIGVGRTVEGTMMNIPDAARWVMAALMIVGRLEIFTILVIFTPTFWKR